MRRNPERACLVSARDQKAGNTPRLYNHTAQHIDGDEHISVV
jgi:hypothetical protein